MKTHCTFISKERRVNPVQYKSYLQSEDAENDMTLWKNDCGSSAAILISKPGIQNARLTVPEIIDNTGRPAAGITVKAQFQKFIPTYTGSNWIPNPRSFQPPKPPSGNRCDSADVIFSSDISENLMAETEGNLIQPFWITVSVSDNALPGSYRSKICLSLNTGEEFELVQKIQVLDLTLPDSDEYYLNLWQYPYASAAYYQIPPFSEEHLSIMKHQMEPYRNAGGKTGTASIVEEPWYHQTYCDYPSMIKWKKENGSWTFDYHDFDIWTEFLLQEIKVSYIECYSIVPWENILRYTENGMEKTEKMPPGTALWLESWSAFLTDFVKHLEEKNLFEKIILAMDERPAVEMEAALNLIEGIHNSKGESLKVGGAVEHYNKKIWDRLFTVTPHISGIRQDKIPPKLFHSVAEERRKQGKLTSIYSMIGDYPGTFSMSDPAEAAWTIWYIESCGADGFLKWAYDAWCENPLEDNAHSYFEAGDMFFVYPGNYKGKHTTVRTSPRFEMMAEAIRDIRKLRRLKVTQNEMKRKTEKLLSSVRQFYGAGINNGIGTAGFRTSDEQTKTALENEVKRLHQAVIDLSLEYLTFAKPDIVQFMERIGLPKEGQKAVLEYQMPIERYQNWKTLFYEDEIQFFREMKNQPQKELLILYLYIRFAVDVYPQYLHKGISDKIYYDTFSDFTIWFSHCLRQKNKIGLSEAEWLKLHLKMKLYRLGRLQFETDDIKKRIHIHIPEGSSLSKESCDESFSLAEAFFDRSYTVFDCESWLLSPALSELMSEKNNIIQFQRRFQIQKTDLDSRQAEERVFGKICTDKAAYPENTRLQKTLKHYLLSGKNPGAGFGIIKRKDYAQESFL